MGLKIIRNFCLVIILASFIGCGSSNSNKSDQSGNQNENQQQANKGSAEFDFESVSHDFGKIEQGVEIEKGFIFKNTGDEPLVISEATSSCGCTVPEYTDDAINPGEKGYVYVKFDSEGKPAKSFNHTVTLKGNTKSESKQLQITGKVADAGPSPMERQRKIQQGIQQRQMQPQQGNPGRQQAQQRSQQGGQEDQYGRSPNHPHYQHDHPPQNNQSGKQKRNINLNQQNQGNENNKGGEDKHGRGPNHPHYQHDHPPQDDGNSN